MPYKELMSWDERAKRWHRMHEGTRYYRSPRQLEADRTLPAVMVYTRDGSRAAANAWWERKEDELLGRPSRVQQLARMMSPEDELRQRVEQLELEAAEARRQLQARDDGINRILGNILTIHPDGTGEVDEGEIARDPEVDRLAQMAQIGKPAAAPAALAIKANADRFLEVIKGQSKPLTYREIRQYLDGLAVELGKDADVSTIDESKVESVFLKLKAAELSQGTRKKRWGVFRRFVEYLSERKLIATPGNLHSKVFRFKVDAKPVTKYDTAKVRAVLAGLTNRQRLYALLGLNAGMTSADIGQLTKDMISGDKLTRKRVKTAGVKTVPTVTYTLWPETMELLAECGSDHPTLVLTGKTGEALWSSRLEADGSTPQKDMISQQWKRAKIRPPHKAFRSIGATLLESHKNYGRHVELYLGHSPKSVKDRHYAAPSDEVFGEALAWLRTQLLGDSKKD
jgi:integrase